MTTRRGDLIEAELSKLRAVLARDPLPGDDDLALINPAESEKRSALLVLEAKGRKAERKPVNDILTSDDDK